MLRVIGVNDEGFMIVRDLTASENRAGAFFRVNVHQRGNHKRVEMPRPAVKAALADGYKPVWQFLGRNPKQAPQGVLFDGVSALQAETLGSLKGAVKKRQLQTRKT